ncbi:PfkB family carbohydrate kinase [Streptomyces sp. NBC_01218]|uniref:PfkB family carbohydrate kinase n=1 Tax=Streptomyces sp. NBC_01218 TaxID=2903780 RepID=UPI002E1233B7|nr:PfkB family carbohydrate kinase [Streptomyces sp. NBC_01218]
MNALTPLLVVGDALLDQDLSGRADRLAPDAPVPVVQGARPVARPGGAALAAYFAALDGRDVTLITALGDGDAARTVRRLLEDKVRIVELPLAGQLSRKTRVLAGGVPVLRLDDGDGRASGSTEEAVAAVDAAPAILVADYGRGAAEVLRDALTRAAARVPVVWDPHPRGGRPVRGVRLATPSAAEARESAAGFRAGPGTATDGARTGAHADFRGPADDARELIRAWGVTSVAVTLGGEGALLSHGGDPLVVSTPRNVRGDACGAGDRFAATAAGLLADGELPETAVQEAVRTATRYVEAGGAGALRIGTTPSAPARLVDPPSAETGPDPFALAGQVRESGGTVVAAGGCFDLLHAGHVALLQAARRIGDCLVVCVNSDASVRRRKGGSRPLVPAADRVRVLLALGCVDAVAVFDEDTPERVLGSLRPHVWAKGGDYALAELPEAALVRSWGGEVVLLPYLDGRSTTRLAERAALAPSADALRPARRR